MSGAASRLRVLIAVDRVIPDSGPHRNVYGTVRALSRRDDVALRVLCGGHDLACDLLQRIELREGFEPHRVAMLPANAARFRRALEGCDLVYVPTGLKSFLYAWALKGNKPLVAGPNVTGIPFLMHIYDPSPLMTMKMADRWIEMSQVRVDQCVAAGTPRGMIHLVPHSVDVERFSPQRRDRKLWERHGIAPDARIIIHTGRFDDGVKGIPVLLESFRMIRRAHPGAVLVLLGPALNPAALSAPGVLYLGARYGDEFAALLASADLFLGASRYESFWFCPLEAMSCGLPVVVSEVGAVQSFIPEDGVQGRRLPIVTAGEPAPSWRGPTAFGRPLPENRYRFVADAARILADAAIALLDDPVLMAGMGKAARRHAASAFSEAALADHLVRLFRSAVGQRVGENS